MLIRQQKTKKSAYYHQFYTSYSTRLFQKIALIFVMYIVYIQFFLTFNFNTGNFKHSNKPECILGAGRLLSGRRGRSDCWGVTFKIPAFLGGNFQIFTLFWFGSFSYISLQREVTLGAWRLCVCVWGGHSYFQIYQNGKYC